MAKIQAFVTIGVLVTLSSEAAIAMSPQEIPAEVKSCKAITDDKERPPVLRWFVWLTSQAPKSSRETPGELVYR